MKTPLHKQITQFLMEKRGQWVKKSDIEHFGHSVGSNAYTAVRRTQEMCQVGHRNYNPLIQKMEKDGLVNYRFGGDTRICSQCNWFINHSPTCPTQVRVNQLF